MKMIKGGLDAGAGQEDEQLRSTLYFGVMVTQDPVARKVFRLIESLEMDKSAQFDIEEVLQLGIAGWNMAIVNATGYPGFDLFFKQSLEIMEINSSGKKWVEKIMDRKLREYPEDLEVIASFNLRERQDNLIELELIHQSLEELTKDPFLPDEELEEMQYAEGFINRNALLVKPKAAFWAWLKTCDPEFEPSLDPSEHTIYLIGEKESDSETNAWLKKNFDKIFRNELEGWITDDSYWPAKRNFRMFQNFFEVAYHSMVMDLENEPVIKD